jgi:hypothetical protein
MQSAQLAHARSLSRRLVRGPIRSLVNAARPASADHFTARTIKPLLIDSTSDSIIDAPIDSVSLAQTRRLARRITGDFQ